MKIVFLDETTVTLNDIDFSPLQCLGEYIGYDNSTIEQTLERAVDADIVIVNKVLITKHILEELNNLKLIAVIATGYNNVDIQAAGNKNIRVCNVTGYAATTVPQHTFGLILNLATKAYQYHTDVAAGKWQQASSFTLLTYPTFELAGKTIGIIGFGVIGRGVAKIAEGFGMKVLAYDISEIKNSQYKKSDLDVLLRNSDVITIHCPLTEKTKNLIEEKAISKMKKTAILINTARGGIVDEQALADALNSGRLAGAGVDVLTKEPPKEGNILLSAKNIIVTPHSAWSTVQARQRLVDETAANIKAFIEGQPRNIVV
ncbi:MAG: D-2-hydroxyacid dehydrogenase [Sedimentisphaerales bacterium]|nr:D-2-hydroxyacid dehydrogenase [Sedimentisphaerales bacterium]